VARPKLVRSFIDELPEVQRRQVVDAILEGKSSRYIAKIAGCSHSVVNQYRRRTVLPAIQKAQQVQAFQPLPRTTLEALQQQTVLTREIVQASPFRDRLEKLWQRTEKAADRAERAVRVVKDEKSGELVPVGPDVSAIAPILNQAHKNVELLGRVTGELQENTGRANVAIQIVIPNAAERNPGPVIDSEPVEVRLFKR
jgi:transposase